MIANSCARDCSKETVKTKSDIQFNVSKKLNSRDCISRLSPDPEHMPLVETFSASLTATTYICISHFGNLLAVMHIHIFVVCCFHSGGLRLAFVLLLHRSFSAIGNTEKNCRGTALFLSSAGLDRTSK